MQYLQIKAVYGLDFVCSVEQIISIWSNNYPEEKQWAGNSQKRLLHLSQMKGFFDCSQTMNEHSMVKPGIPHTKLFCMLKFPRHILLNLGHLKSDFEIENWVGR